MNEKRRNEKPHSGPVAAIMTWILPGLGHWWIGEHGRAVIFFVATAATFWGGVAVAGVRSTVTPKGNGLWIAAQMCMGPQAIAALYASERMAKIPDSRRLKAPWPASDIGVVYAGVAGLLNLLIILDTLARTDAAAASLSTRSPPKQNRVLR